MLLALGIVVTQMPGITISAEQLVNEQSESVEETLSFVSMDLFTEADAEPEEGAEEGQDEQTASPEKSTAENADEGDVKNTEESDNDPEETEIAGSVETPASGENVDGETPESGSAEIAEVMDEPLRASAENEESTVAAAEASDKTVDMRVWTPGHGKVMVNGSDYGTEFRGTWDEGTEVQIEAVPDSGYRFDRWYFYKATGGGERTASASAMVIAGTHTEAIAVFGLETASLTITAPAAGQTAETKPQISLPSGAGYSIESDSIWFGPGLSWVESEEYSANVLDPATTFEEGKTYYAKVRLRDDGAGFSAEAGGSNFSTDLSVTGGEKKRQSNSAYTEAISESEYLAYIGIEAVIAVTVPKAAASHDLTFGFLNTGTSASLADLISSVTVNGSNWALTASGMRLTGQIPAGASVSVAMQATDNAGFFGIHPKDSVIPYPGDAEISQDSSTLTFSFTMPENDAVIEIAVSKTVIFKFDVNGGTKGPGWPGDSIRYPDLFAGMTAQFTT